MRCGSKCRSNDAVGIVEIVAEFVFVSCVCAAGLNELIAESDVL